jgi:ribosomal protein L34E
MKDCCEKEVKKHIKKNRDVARCDACGKLILAYENDTDYEKMVKQLQAIKVPYETKNLGPLRLVIKSV